MELKKILLVEDDVDDQLIFSDAISGITAGFQCTTANNGLEAMLHLRTLKPVPSLIFIDLNMPFMNGFECLRQIKADSRFSHIPVIVFTTSDSPADKEITKELGASMFLSKTDDFELLKSNLLRILETDFSDANAPIQPDHPPK